MGEEKKNKESKDKILERLVKEKHPEAKWVEQIQIVGKSQNESWGAVTDEGVYTYSLDGQKNLVSDGSFNWNSEENGEVDHLAMSSVFTLDDKKFRVVNNGKNIQKYLQNEKGFTLDTVDRKWYQKILGFRTGKRWKQVTAIIAYLLLFLFIGSLFTDSDNTDDVVKEDVEETEVSANEEENESSNEDSDEMNGTEQNDDEDESNEGETEEVDASTEETEEEIEETDESEMSQKELEDSALIILRDNFGEMADLELDRENKTFFLTPTDEAFLDELNYMAESGEVLEDWEYLTDSMVELSNSMQDALGDGYILQIVNPFNEENTLLTVQDGSKIYDAFDE